METAEQTRQRTQREAKIAFVGTILADAGCSALYEHMTAEQVERLHDVILTRTGTARAVALHLRDWCQTMQVDPAPGAVRYGEGWNASLEALGRRLAHSFEL